ncbi:MAG: ExbD/TolR family protein [Holosporales bacterium]|jgi:biopolymer transport protein TolR|nr:ExbD/TolR family protein [Holosporales bacterium]
MIRTARDSGRGRSMIGCPQNSTINVTPLVDVMMVLLIIFMITAPMMTVSIDVNLPNSSKAQSKTIDGDQLIVSIDQNGDIFLQDSKTPEDQFIKKITAIVRKNKHAVVFVRGDKDLKYERVMKVVDMIKECGVAQVSLVANQ